VADLEDFLYVHVDGEAVRHLFRVAASIDSMVIGEPQILGQVKDAYRASVEDGVSGPVLSRLFQRAFSTAKRVKNETRIAERPVSVARVATQLAQQVFENFSDKRALLIGAGEMIEAALAALHREGMREVMVANRTPAHARELAERFEASAHGLGDVPELLSRADVVLTSIAGAGAILDRASVAEALKARRNRPIFLIDIGVPRNVDPEVDQLDNAFLYNIDDLQGISEMNAEERARETASAEEIVLAEQQRFEGWLAALEAVPTIRNLRAHADEIRSAEFERTANRLALDATQREGVEALTRSLVNKILHRPLSRLRSESDREEGIAMLEAARTLFGLDASDDPEPGGAADLDEDDSTPGSSEPAGEK
jgi:glutamyl-tRNA reductase